MSKIFVEYQILPQHRPVYSLWIQNVKEMNPDLEVLEGTDQPGLFIEIWDGWDRESLNGMKKVRTDSAELHQEESLRFRVLMQVNWRMLDEWVQGGPTRIRIWHFSKVR